MMMKRPLHLIFVLQVRISVESLRKFFGSDLYYELSSIPWFISF